MKTKLAALAITSVLVLAACGQTEAPTNPGQGQTGTATFNLPEGGADVTYTVTGPNGTVEVQDMDDTAAGVRLEGLAAGSYTLTISKPGFQSATASFTVGADGTVTWDQPVPTTLTPVTGGAAVTVTQEFGTFSNGTFTPSATPTTATIKTTQSVATRITINNTTDNAVTGKFAVGLATVNDNKETTSPAYVYMVLKEPAGVTTKFNTDPKGFGYDALTVPAKTQVQIVFSQKFDSPAKVCDAAVFTPSSGAAATNSICFTTTQ